MLSRREVLRGAIAGGGVSLSAGAAATARPLPEPQPNYDRDAVREIKDAIQGIEEVLTRCFLNNSLAYGVVGGLRKSFETFLKANGKFPDYLEVGTSVFYEIYDWHVRNRQMVTITRQESRYTMHFMFTLLILRYDYDPGFIGQPYDRG